MSPGVIAKLVADTDGVILVAGSGTLVETLLANDLVDELRLMVFPTILGRGRRLFPEGIDRLKLRFAEGKNVGPDGEQIHASTAGLLTEKPARRLPSREQLAVAVAQFESGRVAVPMTMNAASTGSRAKRLAATPWTPVGR